MGRGAAPTLASDTAKKQASVGGMPATKNEGNSREVVMK